MLRSFSEVNEEADRWIEEFQKFPAGAVIALQSGNCEEFPALVLAVWRAGCCVLLCDRDLKGSQRKSIEKLCGVQARVEKEGAVCRVVKIGATPVAWPEVPPDLLKLTSGTTAEPRAVRFSATQLMADCDNICETMGITPEDLNYGVISFTHSYGFSNLITPLLCHGVRLVVAGDVMPRAVMAGLRQTKATVLPGVPALFRHLGEFAPDFSAPRLCISAGAPLTKDVADRFQGQWGRKVHAFYGSSESGGICYDAAEGSMAEGYVGTPLRNVQVELLESQIQVRSEAVGMDYEGVFQPADLLRREQDGYLIIGRVSDMINIAGRKVNPAEIEQVLRGCVGVQEVVVLGIRSALRGEEVAACITGDITETTLREYCARSLPGWQTPKAWMFCDALPTNARGKLSRTALRDLFEK